MTQQIIREGPRRKAAKKAGAVTSCACGQSHTKETWSTQEDAAADIIHGSSEAVQEASGKGQDPDYVTTLRNWMGYVVPAARKLGVQRGDKFSARLDAALQELERNEYNFHTAANEREPRDDEAARTHGARRGMLLEAQRLLRLAREALAGLRTREETRRDEQEASERQRAKASGKAVVSPHRAAALVLSPTALDAQIESLAEEADDAVEAGDLKTAQRLRKELAEYEAVRDERKAKRGK